MATVNFSSVNDPEIGQRTNVGSPGNSSNNRKIVQRGENIVFNHSNHSGSGSPVYRVGTTSSSIWANAGYIYVPHEGSLSKTISSTATLGSTQTSLYSSGYPSKQIYFAVVSNVDSTPDTFTIGPNITYANPDVVYYSPTVFVSGINTSVVSSITNGAKTSVNGGTYTTSNKNVVNGDTIKVSILSNSAYSSSVSTVLSISGSSSQLIVTNAVDPNSGTIVPFQTTFPVTLQSVIDFFGGYLGPKNMISYVRSSSSYVPDIPANSQISTAAQVSAGTALKLSQFVGSGTTFYFTKSPPNKTKTHNTISAGGTFTLQWQLGPDFGFGFGPGMNDIAEIKYSVVQSSQPNNSYASNVVISSASSYNVYSKANNYVRAQVTVGAYTEVFYSGTITIYGRHSENPAVITTRTMQYNFTFYGP